MFFIDTKKYFENKSGAGFNRLNNFVKNKINAKRYSAGFTLIELLVVIAIVIILPTIVIANFPQIKLQFALSRATYKFTQDVRNAQNLALSSVQYKDSFGVSQAVSGYGIYVDVYGLGDKKYIIYADKSLGDQQYNAINGPLDYVISTIDFSSTEPGVVIKQINNVFNNKASINFNPPNPDTTITSLNQGQSSVDVIFALSSDLTRTRMVSVNTSGLIEVK